MPHEDIIVIFIKKIIIQVRREYIFINYFYVKSNSILYTYI